jgi:restriction endonuclease S subunit
LYKNSLKKGDVLLATKGGSPFAVIYDGRYAPAIASSVFTVLRIHDFNVILPTYLQWFLNHPSTTKKLVEAAKGTSTQHIARDVIEQLELPVPSIIKQEMIIKAYTLQQKAMQLRTQINHLNDTILINNLLQIAHGTTTEDRH